MTAEAGPVPAKVVANSPLANPDFRAMILDSAVVAGAARPGQFVHVRLPGACDPLLRRPFSVAGVTGSRFTVVYKRVGKLTARLAALQPGADLDVFGPRGHGYRMEGPVTPLAILVAGGYGVAPLLYLAHALHDAGIAARVAILAGARTASSLILRGELEADPKWLEAAYATDDGSEGAKGTVLDLLANRLTGASAGCRVCACGPMSMLAAMAKRWPELSAEVAAEGHMGCGLGACQGCVIPMKEGRGDGRYARVCTEGPVFDLQAVDWTAAMEAGL